MRIRLARKKPFFDNKVQLDLNSLWVSALISANEVIPNKDYLSLAENHIKNIKNFFPLKSFIAATKKLYF